MTPRNTSFPFAAFIAANVFEDIDQLLNRQDCKTDRALVRQYRQIYALRHERDFNPLNIRIAKKGIPWSSRILLIAIVGFSILAFAKLCIGAFETSASRAAEGVSHQTTIPDLEYYPPEAE